MNPEPVALRFASAGFRCLVATGFDAGARAAGLDRPASFDRALAESVTTAGGRSANHLLSSVLWPGRVRLRPLRHGGLLGSWLGGRFLTPRRSAREFHVWQTLEARGAPVPAVALAASRRRGCFWHSTLGSLNREQAVDALAWIRASKRSPTAMQRVACALAGSIRRFHDAGGLHGDLHLANLLIDGSRAAPRCWLVDLDRSVLVASSSARERMSELMRLLRSVEKARHHECLHPRVRAAFLSAYCQGDRSLRRQLLACAPSEERRLRRHRLGWRLGTALLALCAALALVACSDGGTKAAAGAESAARLSLLATGDTGRDRILRTLFEGQLAVAHAMTEEDRSRPVDGLVLLGDNFYWHGLDREHLVERVLRNLVVPYCHFLALTGPRSSEIESGCRTPLSARHPIPVYAVLGNHDLENPESPQLQREVVPDFLPGWTMSASLTRVIELGQGVSLILFESEVAIRDRDAIRAALIQAIGDAPGPWRILATHRPIATDDLGGPQEGGYPGWVQDAIAASGRPVQLVLVGHHHNLQAFALHEPSSLLQVVAGSGSRAEPPLAQDPPGSLFGALELGFARVDLIGAGAEERLSVSLFGTAPWPILARLRRHTRLAHFEVDRNGSVTPAGSFD